MSSIQSLEKHRGFDRNVFNSRVRRVLVYLILLAGLVVTLLPFVWMILASFKTQTELIQVPPTFWPEKATFDNYLTILNDPDLPLLRFYGNSLFVAISRVTFILFTSSLMGFIFAKYNFRGKNFFFGWFLLGLMLPAQLTMIPDFMILSKLGLIDNLWALVIFAVLDAFGIFMMRQFIESIPNEMLDAARIDGASEWQIYWRIILPQLGPALATLGILVFMGSWNEYLWPLVIIRSTENRTLPLILTWYNTQHGARQNLVMAATVMMIIPILFVYLGLQKWIVKGFTHSGLKG